MAMTGKTQEELLTEELWSAAEQGDLQEVRKRSEYGAADMMLFDENHHNTLWYGVKSGNADLVKYLVERIGLNPLEADCEGKTPWDLAAELRFTEINQYLESHLGYSYEDTYHNPIRRGFFPDPSIVRVNDDYYMVNSTFVYFPCIPISHSKDLIHWNVIGYAITESEWAVELENLHGGMGYWAPDISYCDGRFYITATLRRNDDMRPKRLQMVTSSEKPEGPYEKPVFLDEDGIDPSIFHDDDGRKYMLLNKGARIIELTSDCKAIKEPGKLLWYGDNKRKPEGPHLLKKDGYYYLFLAEGGTGKGHCITVARADHIDGPYEPSPYNPILHQWKKDALIQCCGHGKPVQLLDGRWYIVYLCLRVLNGEYGILGRETAMDPLTWTPDGWPIINGGRGPSDQQKMPWKCDEKAVSRDVRPCGGYPFWKNQLWMSPRPFAEGKVYEAVAENGENSLEIQGNGYDLNQVACRGALLKRQDKFQGTAQCCFVIPELDEEEDTGMTCYYDENSYIKIGVKREKEEYRIFLSEYVGDEYRSNVLTEQVIPGEIIWIKVEYRKLQRSFFWRNAEDSQWHEIGKLQDTCYLSSEGLKKGKRFTGAVLGVYVHGNIKVKFFNWEEK